MTLTIACDDPVAKRWLAALMVLPDWPDASPHVHCALQQKTGMYALQKADGSPIAQGPLGEVIEVIARMVADDAVACYQDGLALHAGCVAWGTRGLLIPGISGAGKTTLTAWLLHQGAAYVTDELVLVSRERGLATGWGRPLHVKQGALDRVTAWAQPCQPLHHRYGAFVPHAALGAACQTPVKPRIVLFVHHVRDAQLSLQRLTRAQAAHRLWSVTANTVRLPQRGFAQVAALCRQVCAWDLTYADVDQLQPLLPDWIGAGAESSAGA